MSKYNIFFLSLLLFFACSVDENSHSTQFVGVITTDFSSISPQIENSGENEKALRNMNEGLFRYDAIAQEIVLGLASSYERIADNHFQIKLRDNIFFHNDEAITSADVIYSLRRSAGLIDNIAVLDPSLAEMLDPQQGAKMTSIDDTTLELWLNPKASGALFFALLVDTFIVPANYSEDDQETHPIGAGPYLFESYIPSRELVLRRFPNYYRETRIINDENKNQRPVETAIFSIIHDTSAQYLAFQAGEVDYFALSDIHIAEQIRESPEGNIIYGLANDVRALRFNFRLPKLQNKALREALAYGINKDEINKTVFNNEAPLLKSHFSPALPQDYNADLQTLYPYDPQLAKEKLVEAGFPDGITLTISTISENTIDNDMALLMQQQLKEVGIEIQIKPLLWRAYFPQVYLDHDFELTLLNRVGYLDAYRVLRPYQTGEPNNMTGYSSPQFDALLTQAKASWDTAANSALYKQAQAILQADLASIFLVDSGSYVALSKAYSGYQVYPFPYVDVSLLSYQE